jgi:hypothetical protein
MTEKLLIRIIGKFSVELSMDYFLLIPGRSSLY